ncbi:MAG: HAD family hydrolase [Erysipelotrichaceae bacterium]|nr:HAD family hydrolase [Erysipelotrichaceae bacterium]
MKVIVFDLDNTLIDRQRAFTEMLKDRIELTLPEDKKHLKEQAIQDILMWDDNGTVSRSVSFKKYCDKYEVTCMTSEELSTYWTTISGSIVYLFDDVIDVITYLKEKYRLAILTNGSPISQRRKLESTGILNMFELSVVSGEVGIDKPDPRIFDVMCERMKVKPEDCLYIGDNYVNDVLGARNAGWNAIYLNRLRLASDETQMIDSLEKLKKIL